MKLTLTLLILAAVAALPLVAATGFEALTLRPGADAQG